MSSQTQRRSQQHTSPSPKRALCLLKTSALLLLSLLLCGGLIGCGDSGSMESTQFSGGENSTNTSTNNNSYQDAYEPPPERPELAFTYLAPRAGRDYVFVPNEDLDSVSRIDADSLAITTVPVGDRPTRLEAIEQANFAVVLNQGSDEVTLIRADHHLEAEGYVDVILNLNIAPRMNQLVLAPDGEHAFVYFSYDRQEDGEPDGNLQTISLIRTREGSEEVFNLAVGFQIRSITFRNEGSWDEGTFKSTHAYVVTDTGLSIIDLDAIDQDTALPIIQVTPDPLDDPTDREVIVAPSGAYAVARDRSEPEIYIVRLSDGVIQTIPLSVPPTDIDLFPGSSHPLPSEDRALVTVREANVILEIPLEEAFDEPSALIVLDAGDDTKGLASIGTNGRWIALYTTLGEQEQLTILDHDADPPSSKSIPLRKSIKGLALSPDGKSAIVFHPVQVPPQEASDAEAYVLEHPGYSIIDLESGYSRLVSTEVEVDDFTFWFDGEESYAVLSFNDELRNVASIDHIDLDNFQYDSLSLGSPPSNLGRIFGRPRVWINQDHPLGRMTFIEVGSADPKTVTGFELNRQIR